LVIIFIKFIDFIVELFHSRYYFFTLASQNNINDAPPPPERGSSYAVMSQQSALRSNGSTASNLPPSFQQPASMKRVSFHDSNANSEPLLRNVSGTSNPPSMSMDTIREDPNVSYFCSISYFSIFIVYVYFHLFIPIRLMPRFDIIIPDYFRNCFFCNFNVVALFFINFFKRISKIARYDADAV